MITIEPPPHDGNAGTDSADDRDDAVIDQIYSAGLLLRSAVPLMESPNAARHVDRAVAELDSAIAVIRRAALARRDGAPMLEHDRGCSGV